MRPKSRRVASTTRSTSEPREIGGDRHGVTTAAVAGLGRRLVDGAGVAGDDRERAPSAAEPERDRAADALAAARHERDLALQFEVPWGPPGLWGCARWRGNGARRRGTAAEASTDADRARTDRSRAPTASRRMQRAAPSTTATARRQDCRWRGAASRPRSGSVPAAPRGPRRAPPTRAPAPRAPRSRGRRRRTRGAVERCVADSGSAPAARRRTRALRARARASEGGRPSSSSASSQAGLARRRPPAPRAPTRRQRGQIRSASRLRSAQRQRGNHAGRPRCRRRGGAAAGEGRRRRHRVAGSGARSMGEARRSTRLPGQRGRAGRACPCAAPPSGSRSRRQRQASARQASAEMPRPVSSAPSVPRPRTPTTLLPSVWPVEACEHRRVEDGEDQREHDGAVTIERSGRRAPAARQAMTPSRACATMHDASIARRRADPEAGGPGSHIVHGAYNIAMISVRDGQNQILAQISEPTPPELLPVTRAGACSPSDLEAPFDVPPADNSAVDGYAVASADIPAAGTRDARRRRPSWRPARCSPARWRPVRRCAS